MKLREAGNPQDEALVQTAAALAIPFSAPSDLKPLIEDISGSRIVMLGEASHGTREFYEWREIISRELIENHGFSFIAVEGDWPPSRALNRFIQGELDGTPENVLHHFRRWPTWMWANREIASLAGWMRGFNAREGTRRKVAFYGLDVYSLFESIEAILEEVSKVSPFLAKSLKTRYECFEPYSRNEIAYARSLLKIPEGCQEAAMSSLRELLGARLEEARNSSSSSELLFDAEQNARIVANAENYFRAMVLGTDDSWNVRDQHMHETLQTLLQHHGPGAKAIVWAHNTHIGDYRFTDMASQGQVNIGGLARETWGRERVSLVGFGTHSGEVIASHAWDGPVERMKIPEARAGSFEAAFHKVAQAKGPNFFLHLNGKETREGPLAEVRGHRAIGVVYHPAYEQLGNYVPTSLSQRYDAFLFFDRTNPLTALPQMYVHNEFPETWPQGM